MAHVDYFDNEKMDASMERQIPSQATAGDGFIISVQETELKKAIESVERTMIYEGLKKTNWHRGKTAELLKVPRRTLQRKMLKYGFRERQ